MPIAEAGCTTEAVGLAEGDAAEVAAIMALLGDRNPMAGGQVMKADAGDHGLVDDQGRAWVSWPDQAKVPYTW
jgi:hypothetical protein